MKTEPNPASQNTTLVDDCKINREIKVQHLHQCKSICEAQPYPLGFILLSKILIGNLDPE